MTLDPTRSDDRAGALEDRRRFLVKAAILPALAVGASALPMTGLLATAGAASAAEGDGVDPQLEVTIFLVSIEHGLAELYDRARSSTKLDDAQDALARRCADHHRDHASDLASMVSAAGGSAPNAGNAGLVATFGPQIDAAADGAALSALFVTLEDALAATHLSALDVITSAAINGTVASILPIEAQHAGVWTAAADPATPPTPDGLAAGQTTAGSLSPTQYAIADPAAAEPAGEGDEGDAAAEDDSTTTVEAES